LSDSEIVLGSLGIQDWLGFSSQDLSVVWCDWKSLGHRDEAKITKFLLLEIAKKLSGPVVTMDQLWGSLTSNF